jgi:hypothetical protein
MRMGDISRGEGLTEGQNSRVGEVLLFLSLLCRGDTVGPEIRIISWRDRSRERRDE